MSQDLSQPLKRLKVDGGAAANNLLMQFQADVLGVELIRPKMLETTALGSAFLAGLAVGVWEASKTSERRGKCKQNSHVRCLLAMSHVDSQVGQRLLPRADQRLFNSSIIRVRMPAFCHIRSAHP